MVATCCFGGRGFATMDTNRTIKAQGEPGMKKLLIGLSVVFGVIGLFPASAKAHVRLDPAEVVPGRQVYWVRVPNEKTMPTTNVRLVVPDGVEVTGVVPTAGWEHSSKTEAIESAAKEEHDDGHGGAGHSDEAKTTRISEITWSGGQIKDGEVTLFGIATNYEGQPGKLYWKAYQTYQDGSVVNWDGSNEDSPAATVEVLSQSRLDALAAKIPDADTAKNTDSASSTMATVLAGAAVLVSLASLFITIRRSRQ